MQFIASSPFKLVRMLNIPVCCLWIRVQILLPQEVLPTQSCSVQPCPALPASTLHPRSTSRQTHRLCLLLSHQTFLILTLFVTFDPAHCSYIHDALHLSHNGMVPLSLSSSLMYSSTTSLAHIRRAWSPSSSISDLLDQHIQTPRWTSSLQLPSRSPTQRHSHGHIHGPEL